MLTLVFGCFAFWAGNASAATLLVTNTQGGDAPGSLYHEVKLANETPAADTIKFAIPMNAYPGVNFRNIFLASPLPPITSPLTIDGTSEPGYLGSPLIRIDGLFCSCAGTGFDVHAAHTKIIGLSITNWTYGIFLQASASQSFISGNWIGVTQSGDYGANGTGLVVDSNNNTIGGTTAAARNVIANSDFAGVLIQSGATKNTVAGNYIGLGPDGVTVDRNTTEGVAITFASGNTIGGTAPGTRNVISGNNDNGVLIDIANGNSVQGNYIGTDASGTLGVPNRASGVAIEGGSSKNVIGGLSSGARNLISGNTVYGVQITDVGTSGNVVEGNYVGTDATGNSSIPNDLTGIAIVNGASSNTVGGPSAGARNVISGNSSDGVDILNASTHGNSVAGDFIGTTADGSAALGNGSAGVEVQDATSNTIGGSAPAGDVIAGNGDNGVLIMGSATGNVVAGSLIGLTKLGTPLPNGSFGVNVLGTSAANTIGGTTAGMRNVISGNPGGVFLNAAQDTTVEGNYIGTNIAGTGPAGNSDDGVLIRGGSQHNIVGGTVPGARNVISGNGARGSGVSGVRIMDVGSYNNTVEGNYIGTNATGTAPVGNAEAGVALVSDGALNTVGGTVPGARNVISGNLVNGLDISAGDETVEGNYIGTNPAGTAPLPNACSGISLQSAGTNSDTIGGNVAGAGNVISGNGVPGGCGGNTFGVLLQDASYVSFQGNRIGTNAAGTASLANLSSGIALLGASHDNMIGGTDPGDGNVISANADDGIDILGTSTSNQVVANRVGTNGAGTGPLGNANYGIYDASSGNIIGGTNGKGNTIAFNGAASGLDGIDIDGASHVFLEENAIFSNGGLGIALVNNANNSQVNPVITSVINGVTDMTVNAVLQNSMPNATFTIEVFASAKCDPSGIGEGQKFLAAFTKFTDNNGNANLDETVTPGVGPSMKFITETATGPNGTSAFSNCTAQ